MGNEGENGTPRHQCGHLCAEPQGMNNNLNGHFSSFTIEKIMETREIREGNDDVLKHILQGVLVVSATPAVPYDIAGSLGRNCWSLSRDNCVIIM